MASTPLKGFQSTPLRLTGSAVAVVVRICGRCRRDALPDRVMERVVARLGSYRRPRLAWRRTGLRRSLYCALSAAGRDLCAGGTKRAYEGERGDGCEFHEFSPRPALSVWFNFGRPGRFLPTPSGPPVHSLQGSVRSSRGIEPNAAAFEAKRTVRSETT